MSAMNALLEQMGARAKHAARTLATTTAQDKNTALLAAAAALRARCTAILSANAQDVASASHATPAFIDRLTLNEARIEAMARGIETIAALPDPVGRTIEAWDQPPHGLHIRKVAVPLGVVGMIYESRPNVTADAAAMCIKSGNAVLLRGGSESLKSSQAIAACLHEGLAHAELPADAVQLVGTADRAAVDAMLALTDYLDVLIPRGGASLTAHVARHARVPTLLHLDGNCHTYLHMAADAAKAQAIVRNAKLRRTGVCGATESLLVDEAIYASCLPEIIADLLSAGCALRGDAQVQALDARIAPATEEDWSTEYLDAVLSIKVVANLDEAIAHINLYGSHHTDAIVTEDDAVADRFCREVDSAIVMVNSSTQFADGGEFGFGGEIGIATGRLHARGPVGCRELCTYKYIVQSGGAVRP